MLSLIIYIVITSIIFFIFFKFFSLFFDKLAILDEDFYRKRSEYKQKNEKDLNTKKTQKVNKVEEKIKIPECLEILGFTTFPETKKDIQARYKKLSKIYHPDMGGTVTEFQRISDAYKEALLLGKYKEKIKE